MPPGGQLSLAVDSAARLAALTRARSFGRWRAVDAPLHPGRPAPARGLLALITEENCAAVLPVALAGAGRWSLSLAGSRRRQGRCL